MRQFLKESEKLDSLHIKDLALFFTLNSSRIPRTTMRSRLQPRFSKEAYLIPLALR